MNPILKTRSFLIVYAIIVFALATAYAVLLARGTGIGSGCIVLDIFIYGMVVGLLGLALWTLMRYAAPQREGRYRIGWIIISVIIATVTTVGIECIAIWACLENDFTSFAPTIPVRIFITVLIYSMLILFYEGRGIQADEETPQPLQAAKPQSELLERITLKTGGKIKVIAVDDVEYLQAEGDYVAVVTREGRWLKEQTMKYFEEHLPEGSFVRIHRSYIVNIARIARIERYGSLYQVALRNSDKIKVSAAGYKLLKEQLNL